MAHADVGPGNLAGQGTIFKITPTGAITTLHRFSIPNGGPSVNYDGYTPAPRLAEGSDGNFYGTTSSGGTAGNSGMVFKITPAGAFTRFITSAWSGRRRM